MLDKNSRKSLPIVISKLYTEFFNSEKASGFILIGCTIISLLIANSGFGDQYQQLWSSKIGGLTVAYWINDALMAVFFLLVGVTAMRRLRRLRNFCNFLKYFELFSEYFKILRNLYVGSANRAAADLGWVPLERQAARSSRGERRNGRPRHAAVPQCVHIQGLTLAIAALHHELT